jgi:hypothetical protein
MCKKTDSISTLTTVLTSESSEASASNRETDCASPINLTKARKRGQPKGTTRVEILCAKQKKQMAINYATSEASYLKITAKSSGDRVPKGTYDKIIKEAEEKNNLGEGSISKYMLLMRLREMRKTITGGKGHVSSMISIEAHFIDLILQLASMHQPLTATDTLNVINSMVETSKLGKEVMEWKKKIFRMMTMTMKE